MSLDEQLGYDADHSDPSQYCQHGTWIGSWWGPDYMCQWCEDGVSVEEMRYALTRQHLWRAAEHLGESAFLVKTITEAMAGKPYDAGVAQAMTNVVLNRTEDWAWNAPGHGRATNLAQVVPMTEVTTIERQGWTIMVLPCQDRARCFKVVARKGKWSIHQDRLTQEEVDAFDPNREWALRDT